MNEPERIETIEKFELELSIFKGCKADGQSALERPCYSEPLDSPGETIASLREIGNKERLGQVLRRWLGITTNKLAVTKGLN